MAIETIRDLLNAYYGVAIVQRFQRDADLIGTSVQRILKQDPSRIAFSLVNTGTFDIGLRPVGQPTAQKSFIIAANGGTLTGDWREDGELISQEWTGLAAGGTGSLLIVEILIEKPLAPAKP